MRIFALFLWFILGSNALLSEVRSEVFFIEPPLALHRAVRVLDLQGTWIARFQGKETEVVTTYERDLNTDRNSSVEWLRVSVAPLRFDGGTQRLHQDAAVFSGNARAYRLQDTTYVVIGQFIPRFPGTVNDYFVVPVFSVYKVRPVGEDCELYQLNEDVVPGICKALGITNAIVSKGDVLISCNEQQCERIIQSSGAFKEVAFFAKMHVDDSAKGFVPDEHATKRPSER